LIHPGQSILTEVK